MDNWKETVKFEDDHGGLSPVCHFCDRDKVLPADAPVFLLSCYDGADDHVVCVQCLQAAFDAVDKK